MSTLSPGIWEVTYEDDYHDGEYSEKWRLTHHPTMKGCFKVEKELIAGGFEHFKGDKHLYWSKNIKIWSMYTLMSIVRVKSIVRSS